jgi:hypothetical protein
MLIRENCLAPLFLNCDLCALLYQCSSHVRRLGIICESDHFAILLWCLMINSSCHSRLPQLCGLCFLHSLLYRTLLTGCNVIKGLKLKTFELKLRLDAWQVLQDKLLADGLVDLAVGELELLQLPGFELSLSLGQGSRGLEAFLPQSLIHRSLCLIQPRGLSQVHLRSCDILCDLMTDIETERFRGKLETKRHF